MATLSNRFGENVDTLDPTPTRMSPINGNETRFELSV